MKKTVYVLMMLLFASCGNPSEGPTATRYAPVPGAGVYEFRLSDGTRCVLSSGGGIACEWGCK